MRIAKASQARLAARLTKSQKEFFELSASLSGFKSLSDFVIHSTQQVATRIVEQHSPILATEQDKKLFFNTLINSSKPNKSLKEAARQYQKQVSAR